MRFKNILSNILIIGMSALMATPYNIMASSFFEEDFQTRDILINDLILEEYDENNEKVSDYHYEDEDMILDAHIYELEEFPKNTELKVSKLSGIEYNDASDKIENKFNANKQKKIEFIPFEIKFMNEENVIYPNNENVEFKLRLLADDFKVDKETFIAAITEDGTVNRIENVSTDENILKFTVKDFSVVGPVNIKDVEKKEENDLTEDLILNHPIEQEEANKNKLEDIVLESEIKDNVAEEDILLNDKSTNTDENPEESKIKEDLAIGDNIEECGNEAKNEQPLDEVDEIHNKEADKENNDAEILEDSIENKRLQEYVAESKNITVTAMVPEEAGFKQGTELKVQELLESSSEFEEAKKKVEMTFDENGDKKVEFMPFDISFFYQGIKVEPQSGIVEVKIDINRLNFQIDKNTFIAHLKNDGTVERLENISDIDGILVFKIESFSIMGPVVIEDNINLYLSTDKPVYAILYDNGEMVFQNDNIPDESKGNVIKIYDNFIYNDYHSKYDSIPWNNERLLISSVTFNDIINPLSTSNWFSNCTNLEIVNNGNNIDFSETINTSSMFRFCSNLKAINGTTWSLNNCINPSAMFESCSKLEFLDTSSWSFSSAQSIQALFLGCSSLKSIDSSLFDLSSCNMAINAFDGCINLTTIGDTSNWNLSNCNNISSIFQNCENLMYINTQNWGLENCEYAQFMFYRCSNIKTLDTSKWNLYKCKTLASAFHSCSNLEYIDTSNWGLDSCETISFLFNGCPELQNINTSRWNLLNCQNMSYAFSGCTSFNCLDTSNWLLPNCLNMESTFNSCSNLIKIDTSNWGLDSCETISFLFNGCSKLQNINTSRWNLLNCQNMSHAFFNCSSFDYLDTSNWYLPNCWNMDSTFSLCFNLVEIDTSNFGLQKCETISSMFNECWKLNSINTSNWNLQNCKTIQLAFHNCQSIKQIDTSNWGLNRCVNANCAFLKCSNLVSIGIPKWDLSICEDVGAMFYDCKSLLDINASSWSLEKCKNIKELFQNCKSLKTVNVSNWNMQSCKNANNIFFGCESIDKIDLSTWILPKYVTTKSIFENCICLNTLYIGENMNFSSEDTGLTGAWLNETKNVLYKTPDSLPFNIDFNGLIHAGKYVRPRYVDLTVTNTVLGNMGNKVKEFTFTIKLTGSNIPENINYTKDSITGTIEVSNDTAKFKLASGDSIKLELLLGLNYEISVSKEETSEYKVESEKSFGEIITNITVPFTLTRDSIIPTSSDTNAFQMSIIVVITVLLGTTFIFFIKKEKDNKKNK